MTAARLVVGVSIAVVTCSSASPVSAQPRRCSTQPRAGDPSVRVVGAPVSAAGVRQLLARAGVAVDAACAPVRASLIQSESGLEVVLTGDDGRTARRVVSTEAVAATWIESWVRRDLGAPLLPTAAPRATLRPPSLQRVPRDAAPTPKPAAPTPGRWSLAVAGHSRSADAVAWRGVAAAGCANLGPLCVGATGRYGAAGELTANDGMTYARRQSVDLLAEVRAPIQLGRAVLAPSAGIGVGWNHTARDEPAMPAPSDPDLPPGPDGTVPGDPNCDPSDPNLCDPTLEPPPYYVGDGFSASTIGLRLDAGLSLSLPITDRIAVDLSAGITFLPTAHLDEYDPLAADRDEIGEPLPVDPMLLLPGEPSRVTFWGIGLRVSP
jgi:hypothetical protein